MSRPKKVKEVKVQPDVVETPKVEVDLMPSDVPTEVKVETVDPLVDARLHYVGTGSVSGEWLFDDIPGSISANTLEEALQKYQDIPGVYKAKGSH